LHLDKVMGWSQGASARGADFFRKIILATARSASNTTADHPQASSANGKG